MKKLAIHGGPKTIDYTFKPYNSIGEEERIAVNEVMQTGILSRYLGVWSPDFYGGPKIQEFEQAAQGYFGTKHAIVVNSCTSGLIAAVGAIGIQPGNEVIVSPWTMSATATSILMWNAIPVFADIESEFFCIDSASVEKNITPHTKAIIAVDIYGHSADMDSILRIAKKHDLKVISDCAQAPAAKYKGKLAGTLADIGVYSLNYHKHIHTGEGGIIVTNNDIYAEKLQLIRNHAEVVVENKGVSDLSNMLGYNFRLGEIEAAIGVEQLKKLNKIADRTTALGSRLSEGLQGLDGLQPPKVNKNCTHVYYAYPLVFNAGRLNIQRQLIYNALVAEGVPLGQGYTNIHLLPMYQQKIAYGKKGFPWNSEIYKGSVDYRKGICPVAERLHDKEIITIPFCMHTWEKEDIDMIIKAFQKVWAHLDMLQSTGNE
ncbi:MAG: DegT/DnrJ/EryC1/StrS family aminotransferase [Thermodesulfobacteriota bacterium]|nr:DegT/DnrJ/EryC1/StrS family aminotransferase [Thermodesulfobacteriota bacterium]